MADYHVGCGIAGIYAGTLNKTKTKWKDKSDVTDETFRAVAEYCAESGEIMTFSLHGKRYKLMVVEVEE